MYSQMVIVLADVNMSIVYNVTVYAILFLTLLESVKIKFNIKKTKHKVELNNYKQNMFNWWHLPNS